MNIIMGSDIARRDAHAIGRNSDFENIHFQKFAIPPNIIYYITQNPTSASGYQNLIQSCKYFYRKKPVIIVDDITFADDRLRICKNDDKKNYGSLTLIQAFCQFWVLQKATFFSLNNVAIEFICEKMFRTAGLHLYKSDNVVLDHIMQPETIQSIRNVYFYLTVFKNPDGNLMSIEKVFKFFPNLESFGL